MPRQLEPLIDEIVLDRGRPDTLVSQLCVVLRRIIVAGAMEPGTRLPSTRTLARLTNSSRNTISAAYDQLASEGYLTATTGAGTFVAAELPKVDIPTSRSRPPTKASVDPELSKRGRQIESDGLAAPPASKIFAPGIPALDQFPRLAWQRLLVRTNRLNGRSSLYMADKIDWPGLRSAVAAYIGPARGVICHPDQVIILSSARQAFQLASTLLADPGDKAWVENPCYTEFLSATKAAQVEAVPVTVDAFGLDVGEGVRKAPEARLAFVTPSHQFPIGCTLSWERRHSLIDWARRSNSIIVEDDYDGEFRFDSPPLTALWGLDGGERVIYVGTFSKSMFPSLRLAFMVVPGNLVEAFKAARFHLDGHASMLGQAAVAEFLQSGCFATHVRHMRGIYRARREALEAALQKYLAGILDICKSDTGLHLAIKFDPEVDEAGVLSVASDIAPASLSKTYFGKSFTKGLILGYSAWNETQLERGVIRLARALEATKRLHSAA